MAPEAETAAEHFARTGRDAVTYARQVARTAKARYERRRGENAELAKQFGKGRLVGGETAPTPSVVRNAAKRFRAGVGLPVPALPSAADLVPVRPEPAPRRPRAGDEDEDFSQSRIMIRGE
ncbi:hypothetical protein [Amycolatopsis regifaucium]|uniref:Uncharacterized protein n=1 Tax=Amycolatopsis regifaucium TaxID=546365 RepID=A0A154MBU0_9PSEU|nr:hypothetical protein [Amycolatopsis regifaucium]KZB82084.1 hypothetical protein AVL48_09050 [Amycolatopsis regifaucium]OKA05844.1 hypothetical protein ATP06_0221940 [Amycolatopsis regifaucium]SFG82068.1 hypothetical protein SAMN04489731_101591 [Amycolatopsis regifaucium]